LKGNPDTNIIPSKDDTLPAKFQIETNPININFYKFHLVTIVHVILIMIAGTLCYVNTFTVPFIFDDFWCIVDNPAIKNFDCFPDTKRVFTFDINPDLKNSVVLRPITYFTFALNHTTHKLDLFGYHLVNLLLHLSNAVLFYLLFRTIIRKCITALEAPEYKRAQEVLPLFAALLFVCHPLQTQAVTYIVQRFVPMATFFYLIALIFYAKYREATMRRNALIFYLISLTATLLAMESKEIAFTLPVIMLLLEFIFYKGSMLPRLSALAPFLVAMAIIPLKLLNLSAMAKQQVPDVSRAINLVNFNNISPVDYLMTQFGVILTYLRLLILPVGQNFDYDRPLQQSFFTVEVLVPFLVLALIVATGIYFLNSSGKNGLYKVIAFGIFWFFITLSVESSVVPIDDLMYEHRVYLPSIGFFMTVLASCTVVFCRSTRRSRTSSKNAISFLITIVVLLSIATIARNMVWRDEVELYHDVVQKSPNKYRPHFNLGEALTFRGSLVENKHLQASYDAEARIHFLEAIRLDPRKLDPHKYLANIYARTGNVPELIKMLESIMKIAPDKKTLDYLNELKKTGK